MIDPLVFVQFGVFGGREYSGTVGIQQCAHFAAWLARLEALGSS